jgi:hypothetical protein
MIFNWNFKVYTEDDVHYVVPTTIHLQDGKITNLYGFEDDSEDKRIREWPSDKCTYEVCFYADQRLQDRSDAIDGPVHPSLQEV